MDTLLTAAATFLAAVLTALGGVAVRAVQSWAEQQAQAALATVQQRIGEAAARKAAVVAMEIAADPEVNAASRALVEAGAAELRDAFAETARKHGLTPAAFARVFTGELAKAGVRVAP